MENLFDKNVMIPRALKKMGIYGDYILEVRGEDYTQRTIKRNIKSNYSCVLTSMKDWRRTKMGREWWRSQVAKYICMLTEMIINKSKSNS